MPQKLSRRSVLSLAVLAGCAPRRANRYPGLMFVASGTERGIAVADLSNFRRIQTVGVPGAPVSLVSAGGAAVAVCSDPPIAVRIDPASLSIAAKLRVPARPVSALAVGDTGRIAILCADPDCVVVTDAQLNSVAAHIALSGRGETMDVWRDPYTPHERIAISIPEKQTLARISLNQKRVLGHTAPGAFGAPLRFRRDGKELLAGQATARQVVAIDWETGALLARLPLAIQPRHFCFNDDGGQMFVTGTGGDVAAIVAPFQNDVDATIPVGREPGPMTVSAVRNLLLVSNPSSGDLTILDIGTRELAASVHVGDTPREVLVTPDGEYALTVNKGTGSVAVIRLSTVLNPGENALTARGIKPLFTVFPMTSQPEGAIILPFSA